MVIKLFPECFCRRKVLLMVKAVHHSSICTKMRLLKNANRAKNKKEFQDARYFE